MVNSLDRHDSSRKLSDTNGEKVRVLILREYWTTGKRLSANQIYIYIYLHMCKDMAFRLLWVMYDIGQYEAYTRVRQKHLNFRSKMNKMCNLSLMMFLCGQNII